MTKHLGGYIVGGDPYTYCDKVWDWALREFDVKTMIDIGCGEGHSTAWFEDHGCNAVGVEGSSEAIRNKRCSTIRSHDYCDGPLNFGEFDLAWSCEFVEHVEEKFVDNFLATFKSAKILMMTHAVPGQAGYHHVNCQPSDYWIRKLTNIGFWLDTKNTEYAKSLQSNTYFQRTGLIFHRLQIL